MKKILKNWKTYLKEGHYAISQEDALPIKSVALNWSLGQKPYNEDEYHAVYTVDELLEYRDFEWMEETEPKSPEEWNAILKDVKELGTIEPVVIYVGRNGQAKIGEGNNRLAVAKQLNITKIPVKFVFFEDEIRKGSKMTLEPPEIATPAEEMHADSYYTR